MKLDQKENKRLKARLVAEVIGKCRLVNSDVIRVELYYGYANIILNRIGTATVNAAASELDKNGFKKLLGFYGGAPVEIISVNGIGP